MNGGVDKIDTSYEELRTDIQKRLSTARNKDEYIINCKKILQEIARGSNSDKMLDIYGGAKTLFYDFTPDLIKEIQQSLHNQKSNEHFQKIQYSISEQQIGKATVNMPTIKKSEANKQVTRDEQELEQGKIKE